MLIHRAPVIARFTRSDATRLGVAAGILMLVMTAILGADILPEETLQYAQGDIAPADIIAPRTTTFDSQVRTEEARAEAREGVPPQYTYTTDAAIAIAAEQATAFDARVDRVDTAFGADLSSEERTSLLEVAIPDLSEAARAALVELDAARWAEVRTQAGQVLQRTLLLELRETDVPQTRTQLAGRMAGGLDATERMLAAALIAPLVVPNSSFDQALTDGARDAAAAAVDPVRVSVAQGEIVIPTGKRLDAADMETIQALDIGENAPDIASFAGWLLLSVLVVAMLLAWIWRFRPTLWHRNNVIVLIGLLLAGTTIAMKVTAGRAILGYFLPTAAIGMLLAILLDASVATIVMAVIAIIGGALNDNSLEFAAYTFLGGMSGIIAVRKGDRLQVFVQAAIAIFVVNIVVVSIFSLLGARDIRGVLEMWFASGAAAIGSSVAAVGTFAVLGSVFGILTVFQLLELANPSQPLLRRLLVETPGTYHHSLMVGNLAERAAEAIGADPLVTRVAAYYHDVGKLSNPLAFIENQAGGENIHDQLEPEVSAQVLKQHVADGIDTAYAAKLPKALIAFIPQHHGTAIMSYFYARARERAAEAYGGLLTAQGEKAAEAVDERRFRHAGPKPQTREAALIMLADGVEASVRSLAARDEPAIRAMVGRIIDERISDGQFDECDLTLRDLERIRNAFVQQLLGMYHTRIAYPQNTVVELESRRVAAAGGGGRTGGSGVTGGPGWRRRGRRARVVTRPIYRPPWRLDLDVRAGVRSPLTGPALAEAVAAALEAASAPAPASIGLILADDAELAGLNATHMGVDGPTDVLSFPLVPPETFPPHPGRGSPATPAPPFALPPGRRLHLGDIVVSVERAAAQAASGRGGHTGDVRWSAADELRLLVTHGVLHVCGWDHAEPDEEAAMRAMERRLLGLMVRRLPAGGRPRG